MDGNYNHVSPCGVNCLDCLLHESRLTEEYRARAAALLGIAPDEVHCAGCRAERGRCLLAPSGCATWACVQEKGVRYCFECGAFPCGLLAPSAKGAGRAHNLKVYNLCRMKSLSIDTWLGESAHNMKLYFEGEFIVGKGPVLEKTRITNKENFP